MMGDIEHYNMVRKLRVVPIVKYSYDRMLEDLGIEVIR